MNLQTLLIQQLVTALVMLLSPEVLKRGLDVLLDLVEEAVSQTENRLDDLVVLRLCAQIRQVCDVPDHD